MKSITFFCFATYAGRFDAFRTASCGQVVLRSWYLASEVSEAAASLTIFRRRSLPMLLPPSLIGVDEPMFVLGAIARTSAASLIQTPADAARAPFGET